METYVSASALEETPHETETIQITISDALRRRAQAVLNDQYIDPQWRSIIRYALEINDPLLPDLVRRADAGIRMTHFHLLTGPCWKIHLKGRSVSRLSGGLVFTFSHLESSQRL